MGDPSTRDDVMAAIRAVAQKNNALYPILDRLERSQDLAGVLDALSEFGRVARSRDSKQAVEVIREQIAAAAPKSGPNRDAFERLASSLLLPADDQAIPLEPDQTPRGDELLLTLIVAGKSAAELDVAELLDTHSNESQPITAGAQSSDPSPTTPSIPRVSPVPNPDDYIRDDDWECGGRDVGMARASGLIRNPSATRESFLILVGLFDDEEHRVGELAAIVPRVASGEAVEWSTPASSLISYDDFSYGTVEAITIFDRGIPADSASSPSRLPGIAAVVDPDDYISDDDWECGGRDVEMARASGLIRNPSATRESFLIFVGLFDDEEQRVGGLAAIVPKVEPGEAVEWSTPASSLISYDDFSYGTIEAITTFNHTEASKRPAPSPAQRPLQQRPPLQRAPQQRAAISRPRRRHRLGVWSLFTTVLAITLIVWAIYANQTAQRVRCVEYKVSGVTRPLTWTITCILNGNA